MESLLGKTLKNRYRVDELLGRGGMADVYKVWDLQRGVPLAMKVLREDLAEDIIFLRRFEREAKNLTRLQHPNIVRCYGLEREGHTAFMLMDYIDGWTLRGEIFDAKGPLPLNRILEIMQPVCSALNYAHQMGMVHCDVKSANIMIHKNGMVYLTDFGIARGMDAATSTMVGIGTPAYMAPELIRGEDPTPQTDIYALGIVLYEMLTGGERPFTGERATITGTTAEKVRWEHLKLEPTPLSHFTRNIPAELERVVMICLSKDPRQRFHNTDVLSASLQKIPGAELVKQIPQRRGMNSDQKNLMTIFVTVAAVALGAMLLRTIFSSSDSDSASGNTTGSHSSSSSQNNQGSSTSARQTPTGTGLLSVLEENTPTPQPSISNTSTSSGLSIGSTKRSSVDGMTLLYVPAGNFEMGSKNGDEDEQPVHTVWLDAFWIDETEVTNGMYEACVADGACDPQSNHSYTNPDTGTLHFDSSAYADYPAVYVNWEQANDYCEWAGRRLPTEAEWEKAAKGDTTYEYPWGNSSPNSRLANFNDNIGDTVEVGSYPAGASMVGALDMAGNVYEWVSDWYDEDYYSRSPSSSPQGPSSGNTHVLRGGSFYAGADYLRVTYRAKPGSSTSEGYGSGNWGFRCAMDAE